MISFSSYLLGAKEQRGPAPFVKALGAGAVRSVWERLVPAPGLLPKTLLPSRAECCSRRVTWRPGSPVTVTPGSTGMCFWPPLPWAGAVGWLQGSRKGAAQLGAAPAPVSPEFQFQWLQDQEMSPCLYSWPPAATRMSVIRVQAVGYTHGDPGQRTVPKIPKCSRALIFTGRARPWPCSHCSGRTGTQPRKTSRLSLGTGDRAWLGHRALQGCKEVRKCL